MAEHKVSIFKKCISVQPQQKENEVKEDSMKTMFQQLTKKSNKRYTKISTQKDYKIQREFKT